jgi:hypothetical protein
VTRNLTATIAAALLACLSTATGGCAAGPALETVLASAGGTSRDDAYRVNDVGREYEIVRALGLEVESQALVTEGRRAYDVLTARNPRTGETREVWFDITSFFGRGF